MSVVGDASAGWVVILIEREIEHVYEGPTPVDTLLVSHVHCLSGSDVVLVHALRGSVTLVLRSCGPTS